MGVFQVVSRSRLKLESRAALPELPHGLAVLCGVGAGEMGGRTRGGNRAHGGPAPAHLQGGASPRGFRVPATSRLVGGHCVRAGAGLAWARSWACASPCFGCAGRLGGRRRWGMRSCAAWPAKRGCRWRSSCATSSARLRQPGRRERLPQEACDSNGTNPPPTGGDVHHACPHKSPCGIACSCPVVGAP